MPNVVLSGLDIAFARERDLIPIIAPRSISEADVACLDNPTPTRRDQGFSTLSLTSLRRLAISMVIYFVCWITVRGILEMDSLSLIQLTCTHMGEQCPLVMAEMKNVYVVLE